MVREAAPGDLFEVPRGPSRLQVELERIAESRGVSRPGTLRHGDIEMLATRSLQATAERLAEGLGNGSITEGQAREKWDAARAGADRALSQAEARARAYAQARRSADQRPLLARTESGAKYGESVREGASDYGADRDSKIVWQAARWVVGKLDGRAPSDLAETRALLTGRWGDRIAPYVERIHAKAGELIESGGGGSSQANLRAQYPALWAEAETTQHRAQPIQDALNAMLADIAHKADLVGFKGHVKSVTSIVEKTLRRREEKPDYATDDIKDHVRGALIVKDYGQVQAVVNELARRGGWRPEVHIDDAWNVFGYRGIHFARSMGNGINAEVQIHTPESWKLKEWSDPIYRKWRQFTPVKLSAADAMTRQRYAAAVRESYEAWESFWSKVPEAIRRAAVSSVMGLESEISPNVSEVAGTQLLDAESQTNATLPEAMGRRSTTPLLPTNSANPGNDIASPRAVTVSQGGDGVNPDFAQRLAAKAAEGERALGQAAKGGFLGMGGGRGRRPAGNPVEAALDAGRQGFSPRTWGWSAHIAKTWPSSFVFPTHVGMVRSELSMVIDP